MDPIYERTAGIMVVIVVVLLTYRYWTRLAEAAAADGLAVSTAVSWSDEKDEPAVRSPQGGGLERKRSFTELMKDVEKQAAEAAEQAAQADSLCVDLTGGGSSSLASSHTRRKEEEDPR